MNLTAKQQRFVAEYVKDLNASQAAIRAGYSSVSARNISSNLMTKANIQAAIAERMGKRSERTAITADRVLQELARLAFVDVRKAYNMDGSLKPLHEIDDDTAAAIAGMDMTETASGGESITVLKKIKLIDKKGALELLMRHLGMNTSPLQVDLDSELKRLEIEKRKAEIEQIRRSGGSDESKLELVRKLFEMLPS